MNPLVIANWKMHKSVEESVRDAARIAELADVRHIDVGIAPSVVWQKAIHGTLHGTGLFTVVQDAHFESSGAYTGAVSFDQLAPFSDMALVGHSERRHVFGDTDELVALKAQAAQVAGLRVVLCVGETREERESGDGESVVRRQIASVLDAVDASAVEMMDIAYEPVWAISGGDASVEPATTDAIAAMHSFVRSFLRERVGESHECIRVLYGGSVKPENVAEIFAVSDVQGALVGGASLDPDSFVQILEAVPLS